MEFGLHLAQVSSLHGRVYRCAVVFLCNLKCFLPTWEGVSMEAKQYLEQKAFPPYMGGCIVYAARNDCYKKVSSLYGRVYHIIHMRKNDTKCFLPIREGVSWQVSKIMNQRKFPPCTGGCIGSFNGHCFCLSVSSLHGRVYQG